MILVRDIFQMQKASPIPPENHHRMLTDLTGQYYTLVLESTYKDLSDFEKALHREMAGAGDISQKVRAPR
jgi:hypothetical protein